MMRRTLLKLAGLGGASTLLSGCGSTSWKQKLTITVQTPTGEKSGSAVTQVDSSVGTYIGAGTMANQTLQGEATVVDLGQGKYLFGLLGEKSKTLAWQIFENEVPKDTEGAWSAISGKQGVVKTIPYGLYPMMVTFGNLSDPKSVEEVYVSNLAATFGAGYSLKSITLEITEDKVTEGVVEKVLPWVVDLRGAIDKSPYDTKADPIKEQAKNFYRNINDGSFRQGISK